MARTFKVYQTISNKKRNGLNEIALPEDIVEYISEYDPGLKKVQRAQCPQVAYADTFKHNWRTAGPIWEGDAGRGPHFGYLKRKDMVEIPSTTIPQTNKQKRRKVLKLVDQQDIMMGLHLNSVC